MSSSTKSTGPDLSGLVDHVDHFQRRVIREALLEATSAYWLRRAAEFDRVGTPAADETAQACRNAATIPVLTWGGGLTDD